MGYRLGVDLGTTYTAAAVHRPGSAPAVVSLGQRAATIPSVLYLGRRGSVLIGDAAERRALTEPDRVVRQFKRRIGDETPLLAGAGRDEAGSTAHTLAARMIALVADRVAEREGGAPDAIAATVPASWGPHKKDLLAGALAREGMVGVRFVPEPTAAALAYARTGRLLPGSTLAVYDLGGGTFDAALLRAEPDGSFAPLGRPGGIAELGGIDFDDAVLAHVLAAIGGPPADIHAEDPLHVAAMARLRQECMEAKEALSADTVVTIPVLLGAAATSVRLTRAEFEGLIAEAITGTFTALDAALDSAALTDAELGRVLLTGGSSRIPLVTQLLSARYPGVEIDRDIDPKLAVAIGGVLALEETQAVPVAAPPADVSTAALEQPTRPPLAGAGFDLENEPEPAVIAATARRRRLPAAVGLAAALVVGAGFGAATLWPPDSRGEDALPAAGLEEAAAPGEKDGPAKKKAAKGRAAGDKAEDKASGQDRADRRAQGAGSGESADASGADAGSATPAAAPKAAPGAAVPQRAAATDGNPPAGKATGEAADQHTAKPAGATAAPAQDREDTDRRSAAADSSAATPAAPATPAADSAPGGDAASAETEQSADSGDTTIDSGSVELSNDSGGDGPAGAEGKDS